MIRPSFAGPALLAALTMVAFAANSVLTRLALAGGAIDPASFSLLRVGAGAIVLAILVAGRRSGKEAVRPSWIAAVALAIYMAGFTFAYVSLATGTGALLLFGGVQVTMFAGALVMRQQVGWRQWAGMALAMAGLVVLTAPAAGGAMDPLSALLMVAAAIGWGLYSLLGRRSPDPLAATMTNFVRAVPIVGLMALPFLQLDAVSVRGAVLAIVAGGVTSGLGYALWYRVLPTMTSTAAAVLQLSVPVIAAIGGAIFLAEPLTFRLAITTLLIVAGVVLATRPVTSPG